MGLYTLSMSVNTEQAIADFADRLEEHAVPSSERESLADDLRDVIRRCEAIEQDTAELVGEVASNDDGQLTLNSLEENSHAVTEWAEANPETAAEIRDLKDDLKRLLLPAELNLDEDFNIFGGSDPAETFGDGLSELCSAIAFPYMILDYAS